MRSRVPALGGVGLDGGGGPKVGAFGVELCGVKASGGDIGRMGERRASGAGGGAAIGGEAMGGASMGERP